MTTVKFDKAVKYKGVRYVAHEAFKVEDEDVAQLKKAGATVLSAEPDSSSEGASLDEEENESVDENKTDADSAQLREKLLKYTVADMIEFAHLRNIDLQGKTRKADIYNIIVAALN